MDVFTSLITAKQVFSLLGNDELVIVDCSFDLYDPKQGQESYQKEHIPGAVYADLKDDLSGPVIKGKTSRHPLPNINEFSKKLSNWGIDETIQVIAYDDNDGSMAARLWWLLKWLGHDKVAVLDGGFDVWKAKNLPISNSVPSPTKRNFTPKPRPEMLVMAEEMESLIYQKGKIIIDSRAEERYRGVEEPIDPVAGHIPGALNYYHLKNVDQNGKHKSAPEIRKSFKALVHQISPSDVIFYCGSGVTGAHNVLAYYHSGLGLPKLYAGSWSEWITKSSRPISTKERE